MNRGVIIEYCRNKADKPVKISCSGFFLAPGLVLAHGSILSDFLSLDNTQDLVEQMLKNGVVATYSTDGGDRFSNDLCASDAVINVYSPVGDKIDKNPLTEGGQKVREKSLKWRSGIQASRSNRLRSGIHFRTGFGQVLMVVTHDVFLEELRDIMPLADDWKFNEDEEELKKETRKVEETLLGSFVLIQVASEFNVGGHFNSEFLHSTLRKCSALSIQPKKGETVYIESSPFGALCPSVFLNSLSSGVVSNIAGRNLSVLLTDARCLMGSEGAVILAASDGKPRFCGVMVSAFCWHGGQWLGLSLAATAKPLFDRFIDRLENLLQSRNNVIDTFIPKVKEKLMMFHPNKKTKAICDDASIKEIVRSSEIVPHLNCDVITTNSNNLMAQLMLNEVLDAVVGVLCGAGWGSGVVVSKDPGIIITCAHVVQSSFSRKVNVVLSNGTSLSARVVYHTLPEVTARKSSSSFELDNERIETHVWDLAVLLTEEPLSASLSIAESLPPAGYPVYSVGHGIFNCKKGVGVSVSRGMLCKSVSLPARYISSYNPKAEAKSPRFTFVRRDASRSRSRSPNLSSPVGLQLQPAGANRGGEKELPLLLQTSCMVYAGTSGGAVATLHPQRGAELIGIVTCNAQDEANSATHPHVNLAVPTPAMRKIIHRYSRTLDESILESLGFVSPMGEALWQLSDSPASKL